MQRAIEILEQIRQDYQANGKLHQAHVIHNAIQSLKKHERREVSPL